MAVDLKFSIDERDEQRNQRAVHGDKVFWSQRFISKVTGKTVYVAQVFRECECKRALSMGIQPAKAKRLEHLSKKICDTEEEALAWLRSNA